MSASSTSTSRASLRGQHAVVIGGSIAGLLAARVLSDHFARVTIIERDRLPEGPAARKGVPQSRHSHQTLMRGAQIMEELLPGLGADIRAAGGFTIDFFSETLIMTRGNDPLRLRPGPKTFACSRPLLEWTIRKRVLALPQVRTIEATDVVGLISSPDGARVQGVRIQAREQEAQPAELRADLVVDASGRTSKTPQWLQEMGYSAPEETVIETHVGYASRVYQLPEGYEPDWKIMVVPDRPPETTRSAVLMRLEGGQLLVTAGGCREDMPPTEEEEYMAFIRSLQHIAAYDVIKNATPVTPISGYRRMENQRRYYERMERWPEGFAVMGDANCAFNPTFGQGMTVAAMGAQALDECLRQQRQSELVGLGQRFQRTLAQRAAMPWLLAAGADQASGAKQSGFKARLMQLPKRYMELLTQIVFIDAEAFEVLAGVVNLIRSPMELYHPKLMLKVLRHWLQTRNAVTNTPQPRPAS